MQHFKDGYELFELCLRARGDAPGMNIILHPF